MRTLRWIQGPVLWARWDFDQQISLSRFSKDKQFFVLRFDLCSHNCYPFSFDVKLMKKGTSAFICHVVGQSLFEPCWGTVLCSWVRHYSHNASLHSGV